MSMTEMETSRIETEWWYLATPGREGDSCYLSPADLVVD